MNPLSLDPTALAQLPPDEQAEYFLKICHMFKLGCLETEQQHPHTVGLSQLAKDNIPAAVGKIKDLDIKVIDILKDKLSELSKLHAAVQQTLETGGNIYICGCGATGRLSLVLETLWRQECAQLNLKESERVVSFMAGGDAALIKSIEDFQDHPEFAEQQLVQLGFKKNDLLIGSTEGGETSWVIGAVWKSTQLTKRKPFILYGNSDETLCKNVQRSKKFIESEKIEKINMNVGHMAVAGSTRMQSTTILMYAIGLCLLGCKMMRNKRQKEGSWQQYAQNSVKTFSEYVKQTNFNVMAPLIEAQSNIYKNNEQVTYLTDSYFAISILTDTTERAPTFSLNPFQNVLDEQPLVCWCNMVLKSKTDDVKSNWMEMLGGRPIRSLDSEYWEKYKKKVSLERILGYKLSVMKKHTMGVERPFKFTLDQVIVEFPQYPTNCRLSHHLVLKILLNSHSTLIMGRMGRYESNVMTFVRASNYKLVDRAARCIMMLEKGHTYEQVIRAIYRIKQKIREDEPIVMKVVEELRK